MKNPVLVMSLRLGNEMLSLLIQIHMAKNCCRFILTSIIPKLPWRFFHNLGIVCLACGIYGPSYFSVFIQVEDPLAEATKYLKLLQKNSPDSLETHLLSFEVNVRKQKVLLAFQVNLCLIV